MVKGPRRSGIAAFLATSSRDIFSGLIASVLAIAYGLSFAALIFAPPLSTWIAYGLAATFITTAVMVRIVAARSSIPFAIAGPDPTTVAVTATLVTALLARFANEGAPDDLLAPVIIIMALSAALSGIFLLVPRSCPCRRGDTVHSLPGHRRLSRARLAADGERRRARHHRSRAEPLELSRRLLARPRWARSLPPRLIALVLYAVLRHAQPLLLPAVLLIAVALAHIAFALTGTSLSEALALGWIFKAPQAVGLTPTWDVNDLRKFPWHELPGLSGEIFAVMFVTAISTLLNTTGIEFVTSAKPISSAI